MKLFQIAALAGLVGATAAQAAVVGVDQSTGPWLAYMNVFNRPVDGGAFQFGSPWGIADLNAQFNDGASTLTLSPNTIGDPNPYWYVGGGGPGAQGNKIMEANLYQETTGVYTGQMLTFTGNVASNSFTGAHSAIVFIKEFAPDYSSFTVSSAALAPGGFSISLAISGNAGSHVQYGFQVTGENVWFTDTAPFGNAVITTVPTPASMALLSLGGLMASRRRRA